MHRCEYERRVRGKPDGPTEAARLGVDEGARRRVGSAPVLRVRVRGGAVALREHVGRRVFGELDGERLEHEQRALDVHFVDAAAAEVPKVQSIRQSSQCQSRTTSNDVNLPQC